MDRYCKLNSGIYSQTNSLDSLLRENFRLFFLRILFRATGYERNETKRGAEHRKASLTIESPALVLAVGSHNPGSSDGLKFQSAPATSEDANLFRARARPRACRYEIGKIAMQIGALSRARAGVCVCVYASGRRVPF